jgi:hypothetical protein
MKEKLDAEIVILINLESRDIDRLRVIEKLESILKEKE